MRYNILFFLLCALCIEVKATHVIGAVSYTHLDVYKRQELHSAIWILSLVGNASKFHFYVNLKLKCLYHLV